LLGFEVLEFIAERTPLVGAIHDPFAIVVVADLSGLLACFCSCKMGALF